jgi:hypothetical protein
VRDLPDIGRTIPQQEEEIEQLEAKIAKQREVLMALKDVGISFAQGEDTSTR